MSKGIGLLIVEEADGKQETLDESGMPVIPLGADPAQMRVQPDAGQEEGAEGEEEKDDEKDEEGCDDPGKKRRSKGKGRGLARGKGNGPMGVPVGEDDDPVEISGSLIKTIQAWYVEGRYREMAEKLAEEAGIELEDVGDDVMETEGAGKPEARLSFLRKGYSQFQKYSSGVYEEWEKLSDSEKEKAARYVQTQVKRVLPSLKSTVENLGKDSSGKEMAVAALLLHTYSTLLGGK